MKKLPYGISNYERLVEDNYYYVDKTEYIQQLEDLAETNIMFLRPRKFGKTLFASVLENYYDIKKQDKFETLFKDTYIGKNPTKLKNSYHILRFNFSGINTKNEDTTMSGFNEEISASIDDFVTRYGLDFYINPDLTIEGLLNNLIIAFKNQKQGEKIYVIIDEYDHFANELLGFKVDHFKNLVSKNGQVRKWYEILKKGTESVIDRIFITGVAPITLDSMTSGFNIVSDLTQDPRFNQMMGFTKEELLKMMEAQEIKKEEQEKLLPIMKENYDGYKFSIEAEKNIYNSNMCLYFLNTYLSFNKIPEKLVDVNIASDYSKIGNMLRLCKNENRLNIIEKTVLGEGILTRIVQKFNPEIEFGERELVSMLFYLGYLTIEGEDIGDPILKVPNQVMKDIYAEYFLKVLREEIDFEVTENYSEISREILKEGKIDKSIELLEEYLKNLSNRDYQRIDEKHVKVMFYCIVRGLDKFIVKSEMEIGRGYADIVLLPKDTAKDYYSIMIEFKYLKKTEENKLEEKQNEAKEQIEKYSNSEEIRNIERMNKYTVVVINDKAYIQKI